MFTKCFIAATRRNTCECRITKIFNLHDYIQGTLREWAKTIHPRTIGEKLKNPWQEVPNKPYRVNMNQTENNWREYQHNLRNLFPHAITNMRKPFLRKSGKSQEKRDFGHCCVIQI